MNFYTFLILSGLMINNCILTKEFDDFFNKKNNSEVVVSYSKKDIPKRVTKYINKRKEIHGFYISNPNQEYNTTSILTPKSPIGQLIFTGYDKKKRIGYVFFLYGRSLDKEYGCLLYEKNFMRIKSLFFIKIENGEKIKTHSSLSNEITNRRFKCLFNKDNVGEAF